QMNIPVRTVRLSGGGAQNEFWRQLQADIYNTRVGTINTNQGPAYGAAILAGVGTKTWSTVPQACKAIIEETETRKPDKAIAKTYAKHHKQYQRLYDALKGEFENIAHL